MPKVRDIKRAESLDNRVAALLKDLQSASERIMRTLAAEEPPARVAPRGPRKGSINLDLAGSLEDQIESLLRDGVPNPDAPGAPPNGADARPPAVPALKLYVPPASVAPAPVAPAPEPAAAPDPAATLPVPAAPAVAPPVIAPAPVSEPGPEPRPVIAEPADLAVPVVEAVVEAPPFVEPPKNEPPVEPPPVIAEPADLAPPEAAPVAPPPESNVEAPPEPLATEPIVTEPPPEPSPEAGAPVVAGAPAAPIPEPVNEAPSAPLTPSARPAPVDIKSLDDQLAVEAESLLSGEITDASAEFADDTPPPPIPMPRSTPAPQAMPPAPKPVAPPPPPEPEPVATAPEPPPAPPAQAAPEAASQVKHAGAAGKVARQAVAAAPPLILRGLDALNSPLHDQPASVRAVVGYSALITGFWAMVVWAFILFFRQPTPPSTPEPPAATPAKAEAGHAPAKPASGGH